MSATSELLRPSVDLPSTAAITSPGRMPARNAGAPGQRRKHVCVVIARDDGHADAVISAALIFAQVGIGARIEKAGVRIENAQHSGDGAGIKGMVSIYGNSVIFLNDRQDVREGPDGILQGIYIVGRCSHRRTVDAPQDCGYDQNAYDEQRSTPLTLHVTLAFLRHGALPCTLAISIAQRLN